MSRPPKSPESSIEAMRRSMREESTRSERTIRAYTEDCRIIVADLRAMGHTAMPQDVTPEDVIRLLDIWRERGLTVSTRRGYMAALRIWTRHFGNRSISEMRNAGPWTCGRT